MNTFLANAQRQTTDLRTYLREALSDTTGIKYRAESGKKHQIFIPFIHAISVDESGNQIETKQVIAVNADVHEWQGKDGKFKSMICLKDNFRKSENGDILNDGTCPFCEAVGEGWDIYRYRYDLEEKAAIARGLNGDALELYMKGDKKLQKGINSKLLDDRKAREAKKYLYMLVVKYRTGNDGNPILGDKDRLPEFDLKVMKMSTNRLDTILKSVENSGGNIEGTELVFDYPVNDDIAQVVGQSSIAVVFPGNKMVDRYQGLQDKIQAAVSQFTWEGIEKSFAELEGMTTAKAKELMDDSFEQWRKYQAELRVNPEARYLEYNVANNDKPSLGNVAGHTGGIPMPTIGGVQMGIQMPQAGGVAMPQVQPVQPQVQMPQAQPVQVQPSPAVQQFNGAGVSI